jgi:NTE family protein
MSSTASKVLFMRPKIGVALGTGAARGWSQIGVFEGLAALGVVPQVVSGTSIGALVGAAFVTGKLAALKTRMENFGRRDVAAMFDVHLTTGGLIEGRRVETFLDSLGIAGAIETQGPRYAAVATDLASGREIWVQQGPIGRAVRASIGMPGIFSPARHDDRWLIDGGLVNPVPVSLARALGADIVIAVDLNSELVGRRFSGSDIDLAASTTAPAVSARVPQWLMDAVGPILQHVLHPGLSYPSPFEVLANSLNIMQDRITRTRLAGDPPDVLLCPRLGEFSWLDFHRAKEAIAEGLACVRAAEPMIRRACRDAITDL